jgi:D-arabinitol 2-dehydrogenase
MLKSQVLRQAARAISGPSIRATPAAFRAASLQKPFVRSISSYRPLADKIEDERRGNVTNEDEEHEGTYARTDATISVEYPEEHELPSSEPIQGRGGQHFKRTLAQFSMEDKVCLITGGARGLGLVMTQALVESGANVAICDMNG